MTDRMTDRRHARQILSQDVVRELAALTQRPEEDARAAYESELAALESDARVTTYLSVFAKRHARERLMGQRL